MADRVTPAQFADAGLDDWRFILDGIRASFRADSFRAAGLFVEQVAAAADRAGHHPDLDVRYPGVVHVVLTTHASGGLTTLDVDMATTISRVAGDAGLTSETGWRPGIEIGIDAIDIDSVRPFWVAVLGYGEKPARLPDDTIRAIVDPARVGPLVWFQQMDEPRPQRNRIHVDVTVAHDEADARVAAAIAAGGRLVSDGAARAFWVLADAEGNEACVCTWQDRD